MSEAADGRSPSSLELLTAQPSHVLFVLSNPSAGDAAFLEWYQGPYRDAVAAMPGVLSVQHYRRHEVDVTRGHFARPPFRYLGLYELSLDGAEAAGDVIETIRSSHQRHAVAEPPATWLYYPAGEKVGRSPAALPSLLTIAFANAVPGKEHEFREWYATRHIRHALHIPALVSGRCLERTVFQRPGAAAAAFSTIAVYEQVGSPESMIESFAAIPKGTLDFPALDTSRFAESVYRPL
jgi:hypothetical protein